MCSPLQWPIVGAYPAAAALFAGAVGTLTRWVVRNNNTCTWLKYLGGKSWACKCKTYSFNNSATFEIDSWPSQRYQAPNSFCFCFNLLSCYHARDNLKKQFVAKPEIERYDLIETKLFRIIKHATCYLTNCCCLK